LNLINSFIDFIYPPSCISCNKLVQNRNQKICKECWKSITPITKDHFLYQTTRSKILSEGSVSELISCYVFENEGPFQHIIHALKYQEFTSFGIELGKNIGNTLLEWNQEIDVIIPVPLHAIKFRERGYNQSEFIARGIASIICKPVAIDVLSRNRYTKTQTQLNIEERKVNMQNAFELLSASRQKISGKRCLIVDDIITTGATINSCAKEILNAGAKKIIASSTALAR
jgi:ComF family protein